MSSSYDSIVLAGGRSRRMNVADKTALTVGGQRLLDRVLAANEHARSVVVVGPERAVQRPVTWVQEQPEGGGPAAAVAAGLAVTSADIVVLLAGDLPLVTTDQVDRLVAAVSDDGAVFVDGHGNEQWLCGAWRADVLRALSLTAGGSLHRAFAPLTFARLVDPRPALDCDTPADLMRAEELLR